LDNDLDSDFLEDSGSSKSGVHSVSSSSSTSSEDEDITSTVPLGDTWEKECAFQPSDPNPTQRFAQIRVAKTSQTFKQMKWGDALKCRVWFRTKREQESEIRGWVGVLA
jgi:hypothetical protein